MIHDITFSINPMLTDAKLEVFYKMNCLSYKYNEFSLELQSVLLCIFMSIVYFQKHSDKVSTMDYVVMKVDSH